MSEWITAGEVSTELGKTIRGVFAVAKKLGWSRQEEEPWLLLRSEVDEYVAALALKEAKRRRYPRTPGAIGVCRRVVAENPDMPRADLIKLLVESGINPTTARLQVGRLRSAAP